MGRLHTRQTQPLKALALLLGVAALLGCNQGRPPADERIEPMREGSSRVMEAPRPSPMDMPAWYRQALEQERAARMQTARPVAEKRNFIRGYW